MPTSSAPFTYSPGFVADGDAMMARLQHICWERRDTTPRMEYYCNKAEVPYTYGSGRGVRTYLPQPWPADVDAVREKLEAMLGVAFEVCFLNRYLDQSDHLNWHSDDSPEMDDARPIAVVSLGVAREIWTRPIGMTGLDGVERTLLASGSLFLMGPGMQDTHQHRIPKASATCGERISMTFRGFAPAATN